jgi:hypothetical protein
MELLRYLRARITMLKRKKGGGWIGRKVLRTLGKCSESGLHHTLDLKFTVNIKCCGVWVGGPNYGGQEQRAGISLFRGSVELRGPFWKVSIPRPKRGLVELAIWSFDLP